MYTLHTFPKHMNNYSIENMDIWQIADRADQPKAKISDGILAAQAGRILSQREGLVLVQEGSFADAVVYYRGNVVRVYTDPNT